MTYGKKIILPRYIPNSSCVCPEYHLIEYVPRQKKVAPLVLMLERIVKLCFRFPSANWNITIHLSSIFSKSGHGMTSLSNLPTLASWTIGVYVEDELEVGSSYEECFISIASERKEQENCSGIWTANWLWSARRAGSNRSRIWWDWTNLVYAFKHY